jgi:pilus assembly protein Flp/PilA
MTKLIRQFARDESGATAIEYGLIAAGISVAIIAVVQGLGSSLNTTFTSVQTEAPFATFLIAIWSSLAAGPFFLLHATSCKAD